jgi:hypothetical protein
LLFLAFQAFELADAFCRNHDSARAQHQALRGEHHRRIREDEGLSRERAFTRLFVQHVSSPLFVVQQDAAASDARLMRLGFRRALAKA